ncbi:hypothetical protein K439DRAFT_1637342 [Ramaria rubella]|nr:hypothetical protein K439DRAFT_1637342 [Ramaria rubella]
MDALGRLCSAIHPRPSIIRDMADPSGCMHLIPRVGDKLRVTQGIDGTYSLVITQTFPSSLAVSLSKSRYAFNPDSYLSCPERLNNPSHQRTRHHTFRPRHHRNMMHKANTTCSLGMIDRTTLKNGPHQSYGQKKTAAPGFLEDRNFILSHSKEVGKSPCP